MYFYPQQYQEIVQYPIAILILILSFISLKKIKKVDLILTLLLIVFGSISFFIGKISGYNSNIRAILVPIIFIIVFNSNSYKLLKPLFISCLIIVVIEYIFYYSGLNLLRHIPRGKELIGFWLIRPYGIFVDDHSTSLFLALSIYIFGYLILGGIVALFLMSFQTVIAYSVVFLKDKKYYLLLVVYLIVTATALKSLGHLDSTYKVSMLTSYLSTFNYDFSFCYVIGCASNSIIIGGTEIEGIFTDNGFIRTSYFFGVPWLIFYFILIMKSSKNKILPIAYYLTILHYPVAFGIINTAIIGIIISYFNNVTIFKENKKIYFNNSKITGYT